MNFQYRICALKMLCVMFIIELVCVEIEAKIRDHSHHHHNHHHHENSLLRRLGHNHKNHRRGQNDIEGETETTAPAAADTATMVTVPSMDELADSAADVTGQTTAKSSDPQTDPPTTSTESPELDLEAKQLGAKIEKEMAECEVPSQVPEVEYTPPSMPPHIDSHYFHVTPRVPYYTVGPVDPLGYDPPAVKLSSCEKLYRRHVRDDLYSGDEPETEESLEVARLPRDKAKRDMVLRDMFEYSDESRVGVTTKDTCRRKSN